MTKTRIREIRATLGEASGPIASALAECLSEITRLQSFTRRGETPKEQGRIPELNPDLLQVPQAGPKKKARGTLEEFQAFSVSIGLPFTDGEAMFWKMEASDWKIGRNPVKDWKAVMRQWKAAGYHPSQTHRANGAPPARTEPPRCAL